MPELPEVETTCRGIAPHVIHQAIAAVKIHQSSLRWPISAEVKELKGHKVSAVTRRGKYILISFDSADNNLHGSPNNSSYSSHSGTLIIHLGMSGSLRICDIDMELRKHDHAEFVLSSSHILRFHDPRRFGCILWTADDPLNHPLLKKLGPEPLSDDFNGEHLFKLSRRRKVSVKNFVMDSHTVVGVGNIYASESLFCSELRPGRSASRITRDRYHLLAGHIKSILAKAIDMGGTTLRDFVNSDGQPGYFSQQLLVYGREGEACRICETPIKNKIIGQRSSFYCPNCQH